MGQLAIEGTEFLAGHETISVPIGDSQKLRVYTALKVILVNAQYWDKPLKSSMEIRKGVDQSGNEIFIEHPKGLAGNATELNQDGVRKETINGREYYTREYVVSSGTSTWKNGYCIDVSTTGEPYDTILVDGSNSIVTFDGSVWKVPTTQRDTEMNDNGSEYYGIFKLCLPVSTTPSDGNITIRSSSEVTQYNIFLADNPEYSEQSFVIADPAYTPISAIGTFRWVTTTSIFGSILLLKTDGSGKPLMGATLPFVRMKILRRFLRTQENRRSLSTKLMHGSEPKSAVRHLPSKS